jgi:hypothetical protein
LRLDLAVGETGDLDGSNKDQSESLAQRVQDLNARLQDIRREQVFQRVTLPTPLLLPSLLRRGVVRTELTCRNGRLSFVISRNQLMRGLLDGLFYNLLCLRGHVHGNLIISKDSF